MDYIFQKSFTRAIEKIAPSLLIKMEEKYLTLYKLLSIISALIFVVFAFLMMWEEIIDPEWKTNQTEYKAYAIRLNLPPHQIQSGYGIRQIEIESINHIDRCMTCHLMIGQAEIDSLPLPFSSHPASILEHHDLASFGCTLCHNGSGRSLRRDETCDRDHLPEWRAIESHCAHCHLAIFDSSFAYTKMPTVSDGLKVLTKSGCLGCHKLRGIGGPFGPDLTSEGKKILKGYNFKNIQGEKTLYNWQNEHLSDPEKISPGSIMPKFSFTPLMQDALINLILGLSEPDLPLRYYDLNVIKEFKNQRTTIGGKSAYQLLCSACHGSEGTGLDYKTNVFGVPGLANPDFQAVASLDMISFIINEGRGGRYMPAWRSRHSGLKDEELYLLIKHVRHWRRDPPSLTNVNTATYDITEGKELYLQYCSTCHRADRAGGIGPSLNNTSFLSLATDEYLYLTLINGRSNTAMPSWSRFEASSLHSMIRYLQPRKISLKNRPLVPGYAGDIERGKINFHYRCNRCHGSDGMGGIGPAILNRDFLEAAEDDFIIKTVNQGRSHTPMFKIEQSDSELVDLLAYMRSEKSKVPSYLNPGPSMGNPELGEGLFEELCAECHGKNGEGVKAPTLNNQEFLNSATNGYLIATITLGRAGTPMPAWGLPDRQRHVLTKRERQNIVSFIRNWQTITIRRQPDDPIYKLIE
jgi:cytochrome c oxidase cbb3-type subunit 3